MVRTEDPGGADVRLRLRRCWRSIQAERVEDVEREIVDGPNLPRSCWPLIAAALASGSSADQASGAAGEAQAIRQAAQADDISTSS